MNNNISGYYKIIPDFVMFDDELLSMPKAILLYGEITALSNNKGYCWASNSYFAKKFKVSDRMIKNYINKLVEKGFIARKIIYKPGTKEVDKRILSIGSAPSEIDFPTPSEIDFPTPGEADFPDNNINTNNINVNREREETEETNIFDLLPSCGIYMSNVNMQVLIQYTKQLSNDVLCYAANYTSMQAQRPNFGYFRSVLETLIASKVETVEQAEKALNRNPRSSKKPKPGFKQRTDINGIVF